MAEIQYNTKSNCFCEANYLWVAFISYIFQHLPPTKKLSRFHCFGGCCGCWELHCLSLFLKNTWTICQVTEAWEQHWKLNRRKIKNRCNSFSHTGDWKKKTSSETIPKAFPMAHSNTISGTDSFVQKLMRVIIFEYIITDLLWQFWIYWEPS